MGQGPKAGLLGDANVRWNQQLWRQQPANEQGCGSDLPVMPQAGNFFP